MNSLMPAAKYNRKFIKKNKLHRAFWRSEIKKFPIWVRRLCGSSYSVKQEKIVLIVFRPHFHSDMQPTEANKLELYLHAHEK